MHLIDLSHDAFHEEGFEHISTVAGKSVGQLLHHHTLRPYLKDLLLQRPQKILGDSDFYTQHPDISSCDLQEPVHVGYSVFYNLK